MYRRLAVAAVLPLSEITSLSNICRHTLNHHSVLPLSEITSLSNPVLKCDTDKEVLPLSEITSLSNAVLKNFSELCVLPLSEITSLSNGGFSATRIRLVLPLSEITSLSNLKLHIYAAGSSASGTAFTGAAQFLIGFLRQKIWHRSRSMTKSSSDFIIS